MDEELENFENDTVLKDLEATQPQNSAIQITKFKNLARSKFQDSVKYDRDFLEYIRINSSYNLAIIPAEFNELFIYYKHVECYWINESPLLSVIETLIKKTGNKNFDFDVNYRDVKNFYTKWAVQKSAKEKQYFGLSTVSLIERSINNTNFINYILAGIVYALEPSLYNLEKSLAQFEKSKQVLEATAFGDSQHGLFHYYINLFQGLIFLRLNMIEQAQEKFYEAQKYKLNGITAIFYNGLIANRLGDYSEAVDILTDVISFDKTRIQYAIDNKSIPLFNYFLQHAFTYNILAELEFANLCEDIDSLIESQFIQNGFPLNRIKTIISGITVNSYQQYLTESIKKQIEFVITMSNQFDNNPNVLTMMMGTYLLGRAKAIINSILEIIKSRHYDKIEVDLSMYDHEVSELMRKMSGGDGSINEIKASYERGMNDLIKSIEDQVEEQITMLENQIENIEANEKYSPSTSFSNSLFYSVLISIIIFIIFGFTGGVWGGKEINSNYMGLMTDVFSIGVKWGSGTFLIGLVVSFFSAATASWEKTNEKQRLLKTIAQYNNYKDKQVEQVRKDTKSKIDYYSTKQRENARDINERIQKLEKEKETQKVVMKQIAEEEISKASIELLSLLESF